MLTAASYESAHVSFPAMLFLVFSFQIALSSIKTCSFCFISAGRDERMIFSPDLKLLPQVKFLKIDIARRRAVAIIRVRFRTKPGAEIYQPLTDNCSLYGSTY
jgi:hypothetical protein